MRDTKKFLYIIISITLCLMIIATTAMSVSMYCDSLDKVDNDSQDKAPTNDIPSNDDGENKGNKTYTKRVALTFDDGPHVTRTKAIVDELTKYGYHATFFVVGNRVDGTEYSGGEAMKYAYNAGNEIAIHGYTHEKYYSTCSDAEYYAELNNTVKAIQKYIPDYEIKLMRPIGGEITAERINSCEYSVIMWNVDSLDWENRYSDSSSEGAQEKFDAIVNNVMSKVSDGSIILLHDIYQSTLDATIEIIRRLHEEGYDIVTVSELIGDNMQPGVKYSKGTPYKKEGD